MPFGINPISNMADHAETHKDIQTKTKGTSQLSVTTPCGWATHVHLQAVGRKNRGPAGWRKTGKGLHAQCGTKNSLSTLVIGTGLGTGFRGTWYTRGPGFD